MIVVVETKGYPSFQSRLDWNASSRSLRAAFVLCQFVFIIPSKPLHQKGFRGDYLVILKANSHENGLLPTDKMPIQLTFSCFIVAL